MNPDLRTFVDRVIVPALVDRFLREQAAAAWRRRTSVMPRRTYSTVAVSDRAIPQYSMISASQ